MGALGYLIAVQFLDHKDIGMFKISKLTSILLSLVIIWTIYSKKLKKNTLVITTILICSINLVVFGERFNYTRFKYQTIVDALEYYQINISEKGNLGYLDESGVQQWYLKDFDKKFSFLNSNFVMEEWIKQNNIEFVLFTHELGYVPKEVIPYKKSLDEMEILQKFESPFFGGSTKLIKMDINKLYVN